MNQDFILQKEMNRWERMSQDSSFRQAYETREKALMDEAVKFAHARNEGGARQQFLLFGATYKNR